MVRVAYLGVKYVWQNANVCARAAKVLCRVRIYIVSRPWQTSQGMAMWGYAQHTLGLSYNITRDAPPNATTTLTKSQNKHFNTTGFADTNGCKLFICQRICIIFSFIKLWQQMVLILYLLYGWLLFIFKNVCRFRQWISIYIYRGSARAHFECFEDAPSPHRLRQLKKARIICLVWCVCVFVRSSYIK